jgi:hypothetical protein
VVREHLRRVQPGEAGADNNRCSIHKRLRE